MQAVILAAGEGTRMRPLTLTQPKPLVTVTGKPLLEYVMDALPQEIDEIIMVIGYKGDMLKERYGDAYKGRSIRYVHQWMAAGTAHALSLARPLLTGRFLLLNADDIVGAEALKEAIAHPLSILVAPHAEPQKFGVITKREDGTMEEIVEKPEQPKSNLVSTGAMVLDERLFGYPAPRHEKTGEYFMTQPLAELAKEHPVMVVEQPLWIPVGYPEDIEKAEAMLRDIEGESKP